MFKYKKLIYINNSNNYYLLKFYPKTIHLQ